MNHKKQFFKFVIPSVVSMLVFNLYTMVDGIYVARFVGEHALSAVNISMPYVNFIFAFSILFSVGTSTVVAIFRGENNMKSANETFTRNTIFLTVCALIITLLALVFQNELALFLGASEVTLPYVHDYLGVLIWFTFFFIVFHGGACQNGWIPKAGNCGCIGWCGDEYRHGLCAGRACGDGDSGSSDCDRSVPGFDIYRVYHSFSWEKRDDSLV